VSCYLKIPLDTEYHIVDDNNKLHTLEKFSYINDLEVVLDNLIFNDRCPKNK